MTKLKLLTSVNSTQRLALFLPVNAAGHIQSFLTIANQLRADHNVRCVFLVAGPPHTRIVEDHGHQLIELEDQAEPLYDFEIEQDEQADKPMDEKTEALMLKQGKRKRAFTGSQRWPQFMARHHSLFEAGDFKKCALGMSKFCLEVYKFLIGNSQQMDEAIERLNPDVIFCDLSVLPPSMLRHEHARPWVRIWSPNPIKIYRSKLAGGVKPPAFAGSRLFTKAERARMRRDQPELWRAHLDRWRAESEENARLMHPCWSMLARFYADAGLRFSPDWSPSTTIDSPHLNIYMYPEALDYDQDDDMFELPPRWLRCDSLIRKSAGKTEADECREWLERIERKRREHSLGSELVYFSLGSIASGHPGLMQRYIDYLAADESGRLYIVSKGVNGDLVRLDERNMLGANYLPQTFLLRLANVAIIHGGNNSLTECLYFGKPMLVLPGFGDQLDNAQRVEDLRLGKRLDLNNCGQRELLDAIDRLSADRELADRANQIGEKMRARDELAKVSTIVSELIETRRLSEATLKRYNISS
jgi:UDP:flavonoid glycosyltransferase YjiC (YdhE family)